MSLLLLPEMAWRHARYCFAFSLLCLKKSTGSAGDFFLTKPRQK
jgi:hypothetical protein